MSDDVCDQPGCGADATMWRRTGEHMSRCPRHTPTVENILTDLIAELREGSEMWGIHPAADRAEQRLREVQGE